MPIVKEFTCYSTIKLMKKIKLLKDLYLIHKPKMWGINQTLTGIWMPQIQNDTILLFIAFKFSTFFIFKVSFSICKSHLKTFLTFKCI